VGIVTVGDPATSVPPPRGESLNVGGDALYEAFVNASPDTTAFVFGPDLTFILARGAAFERLGWRLEDVLGRRPTDLLSDEGGPLLEEQMRAALEGQTRVHEHVGVRDDSAFWRSTIVPVRDDAGTVVAGLIVSRDIAAARAAEQGRRASEERFAVALEAAPVTVFAQDRELRFIWANKTQLNPNVDSILGKTDLDVLSPEVAAKTVPAKREVLASGEPVRLLFEASTETGLRTFDMTLSATRDGSGDIIGLVGAALDVTELRKSERDLHAALEAMLDSVTVQQPVRDETGAIVDFRISYATANAVDFAGRGRLQMIDQTLRELYPQLGDDFIDAYVAVLQTGQAVNFTAFSYPDVDGRERLYDLAVSRVGGALLVVWREVTEREADRHLVAKTAALRSVSEELQRGLLPPAPPQIWGLHFAATYHPAIEATEVGGDWYDVVQHSVDAATNAAVDLVVGDVEGHDGQAAALMARYSTLVRAACRRQSPIDGIIAELREFHDGLDSDRLTTLGIARIDVEAGSVSIVCAGHPPPLIRRTSGQVEMVELSVSAPIGAPGGSGDVATLNLGVGETLVLFSDGLLNPHLDPYEAIGMVIAIAARVDPKRPDQLVEALAEHALGHWPSDDVVVLAATRTD
jgi:PAS domain S-box-containing protein